MADHKKQHYVPKFYLKQFSYLNNKKQIGVLLPDTRWHFSRTSIKDEGASAYLYGKDGQIEKYLHELEGEAAKVFESILTSKRLPVHLSDSHDVMLYYLNISSHRTLLAGQDSLEESKYLKEFAGELYSNVPELSMEEAIEMRLSVAGDTYHFMNDLRFKIVVNDSSVPFVTSDHPVVKYNQFAEKNKFLLGSYGLNSLGLQIFYPLSPKFLLVLFDGAVYKYGNKKEQFISTRETNDIEQINLLQFIHCGEKIFYNHDFGEKHIFKALDRLSNTSRASLSSKNVADYVDENKILQKESLYVISAPKSKIKLDLSFVKIIFGRHNLSPNTSHMRRKSD